MSQRTKQLIWRGGIGTQQLRVISDSQRVDIEVLVTVDALGAEAWLPCERINYDLAEQVISRLANLLYRRRAKSKVVSLEAELRRMEA